MYSTIKWGLIISFLVLPNIYAADTASTTASHLIKESGFTGGLVVHLGCGDGKLTTAFLDKGAHLVQGLDAKRTNVNKARAYVRKQNVYGKVSIQEWLGATLPFTDNLVNLLIIENSSLVKREEILRVLAPLGVAMIRNGDGWEKIVKPWPNNIDEWTHFLHDASGNAVANDTKVGLPRHIQWITSPVWSRHHDHINSMNTMVSSRGRIFTIEDQASIVNGYLPAQWRLVTRDAFNGLVLWKRDIPNWVKLDWGFRKGPTHLPRRLVATAAGVFLTPAYNEAVILLDGATGKELKAFHGTERTREILVSNGMLLLAVAGSDVKEPWYAKKRSKQSRTPLKPDAPLKKSCLMGVDIESGNVAWVQATLQYDSVSLTAHNGRVCYKDGDEIICLNEKSGKEMWRAKVDISKEGKRRLSFAPSFVMYGDLLFYADGAVATAFDVKNGNALWNTKAVPNFQSSGDLFVVNDLVWVGNGNRKIETKKSPDGRDPRTGEVKVTGSPTPGGNGGRCYRNKATPRFLFSDAKLLGTGLTELNSKKVSYCPWIRGGCQYGLLPANGMVYMPPHACACFMEGKLSGLNATAARLKFKPNMAPKQLDVGPAFQAIQQTSKLSTITKEDWPTYRHDSARSGVSATKIPAQIGVLWNRKPGGKLSSVVVGGGRLFVASVDQHTIHALDSESGKELWTYTANGRIDSPPTLHQGLVLFGSRDGWVYCLRANDGALAWRFRGAPEARQMTSYSQLESAWPIHGSVLVREGCVLFAAGRSCFLDGGIRMLKLDIRSGKLLSEHKLLGQDPKTDALLIKKRVNGSLTDILSADETGFYMRQLKMRLDDLHPVPSTPHLYATAGFLDDTRAQRTFWTVSKDASTNIGYAWDRAASKHPYGRILVTHDSKIYGFGRKKLKKDDHSLWLMDLSIKPDPAANGKRPSLKAPQFHRTWNTSVDFQVHAMALAGDTLLVAGPIGNGLDPKAVTGEKGSVLLAVSATDGKTIMRVNLMAPPVFDGLAVARGRVYISLKNGDVLCLGAVPDAE